MRPSRNAIGRERCRQGRVMPTAFGKGGQTIVGARTDLYIGRPCRNRRLQQNKHHRNRNDRDTLNNGRSERRPKKVPVLPRLGPSLLGRQTTSAFGFPPPLDSKSQHPNDITSLPTMRRAAKQL